MAGREPKKSPTTTMEIKQSSTTPLLFLFVDATDLKTPETGLTPTVTISKDGGAFATPVGSVTEVGNGIYKLTPTSGDTDTLRSLALHATAAGAHCSPMLFEVVSHTRAEVMSSIAALNNLSAAGVRSELATELGRIDVAVSTRNSTTPPTTAAIRSELATELARIDVAVSTRNATTPPTAAAIADAVWDEPMAGHATAGTAGSQLTAAGASGDPWETVVPGDYDDGTAGAAIGRLNNTPAEAPIAVIPAPEEDESLTVVYAYTEDITNEVREGIEITFALDTKPAKSERVLEVAPKTMTTDDEGYAQITLQRGLTYRVTSKDLGLNKVAITPNGETFNLLSIIV
jgi:hypothetical protein